MGHGWPATGRLLDAGIRPSLSIDVCCSNGGHMFGTMRATIGTERGFDNEHAARARRGSVDEMELTCRDVLEFATIEGARACGLDDKIGSLTPGKRADVILVRTDTLRDDADEQPGRRRSSTTPTRASSTRCSSTARSSSATASSLGVDAARVRRLAIESRDDILRRADGHARRPARRRLDPERLRGGEASVATRCAGRSPAARTTRF